MRKAEIERSTAETRIKLSLNLDGEGKGEIKTGCGFLDHMLVLFAAHGMFDLELSCDGDVWVDYHHSVEDIGIVLGQAFLAALGDKRGIARYGSTLLPMDEALILTSVDFSGRGTLVFGSSEAGAAVFPTEKVGDFDTELVEEFLLALVREAKLTLHVKKLDGKNSHHIAEGIFKSLARSIRTAISFDERSAGKIPSTKGTI